MPGATVSSRTSPERFPRKWVPRNKLPIFFQRGVRAARWWSPVFTEAIVSFDRTIAINHITRAH
jgi:hypothetical protein